jgi:hypothetical protein
MRFFLLAIEAIHPLSDLTRKGRLKHKLLSRVIIQRLQLKLLSRSSSLTCTIFKDFPRREFPSSLQTLCWSVTKKKTKTVIAQPSSPWAGHHLAWATARRGDPHLAWWSSPMLVRGSPWTWADLGIPSGSTQPIQNILFLHHNNFDYTHENSWLTPHALNKRECTYFLYKQKALFFIF